MAFRRSRGRRRRSGSRPGRRRSFGRRSRRVRGLRIGYRF